jgi:MFS family permease
MSLRSYLSHPAVAYTVFSAFIKLGFGVTAPTYALYILRMGLPAAELPLLNAIFFGTITLMELPTGMWADGKSRLWSMRAGTVVSVLFAFGYTTATDFWSAATWEMLAGIATAFWSGADVAWLTGALKRRGEDRDLRKWLGTSAFVGMTANVVGGLLGALIGTWSLKAVWIAAGGCHLVALAVAAFWMQNVGEPEKRLTEVGALKESVKALKKTPELRWGVAAAILAALALPFNYYWSPLFEAKVGLANLGWIWAAVYGACSVGGLAVRYSKRKWSDGWMIPACHILTGAGLALAGIFGDVAAALAFAMLHEVGRGALMPLVDSYVQGNIKEDGCRATFGSLQSLISRGGFAVVLVATWALVNGLGNGPSAIVVSWLTSGALLVAAALILWLFRPKEFA